jgi:DNA helicase TIP49 (TBP-interacting protein)
MFSPASYASKFKRRRAEVDGAGNVGQHGGQKVSAVKATEVRRGRSGGKSFVLEGSPGRL